jgi:hypothetical protein
MRGALEVISVVLIATSTLWMIGVGVYWLYNKGELAAVPLVDRNRKPLSEETQRRLYREGVARLHRYYLRFRRGLPWAVGVLVIGIGLAIVSAHITG